MSVVSVTVVGAFESVGAILVVAMLVVPPATAYLLTDRLSRMLLLATAAAVLSAASGYGLAWWWDASIAGAMAVASGLLFALAFVLSPRHGLLARLLRERRLGGAMAEHLLLLHLGRARREAVAAMRGRFAWSPRRLDQVVARLAARGWVEADGDGLRLTAAGAAAVERSGQAALRHRGEPGPRMDD
jgi:manganese/zinc/iron transport system permease protein